MSQAAPCERPAGITITGTGISLPANCMSNDDLSKIVDTSDEWIQQRTGMKQRYVIGEGESLLSLASSATQNALNDAGLQPSDLDFLIVGSITSETTMPSTAARVVADLGAVPAGAMDLTAACSGFVYGLNLAHSLIDSGMYRNIAVVGAETLSQMVNWDDRRTCVLFGDAAGTAIVSASDQPTQRCLYQTMSSDGNGWVHLYTPNSEAYVPEGDPNFNGKVGSLQMNGREVYKFAVQKLQFTIENALEKTGVSMDELAMIVPHQSNARILESARSKLGIPDEKLYINIERYANTSAASIPLCLHEVREAGRVKPGDKVLFVGMGGGLTWASSLWQL